MLSAKAFMRASALTAPREAAFFAALRLPNGTFKTTADHRMDDLNAFVAAHWKACSFHPTALLDVAASSGVASVEWVDALAASGFDVRLTATDLTLWADIVSLYPGFQVLQTRDGVLQYILGGVGIRTWRRRLDYLTGYALVSAMAARVAARRLRALSGRPTASKRVLLVSKRAVAHGAISWAEDDVLATNPEAFVRRFDAVRVANLLNRDHFRDEEIRRAVANLGERMTGPNGYLIVNRTLRDGTNHASLFRLTDGGRFEVQARFGRGSDVEDLVLAA